MKIRNVLSLFDGISCGQVALRRAGILYDKYYASEIEKQPIWVTQYNFPNTIQLGDVEKWKEWDIDWSKIDLLIGGSPCTNLSIAGNRKGLEGEQSRLFYAYVAILNHIKKFNPDVKFLLENVESMTDSDKGIINSHLGCKPIMINSSLLSAQNRKRYYWFNWHLKKTGLFGIPTCDIPLPDDKHILLKDILETGVANTEKSITLCATDYKGASADPIKSYACRMVGRKLNEEGKREDDSDTKLVQKIEINSNPNKVNTLTTFGKDNLVCEALPCALRNRGEGKQPEFNGTDKANSLTTVQTDSMVCEPIDPSCLKYERTEEGKKLRKDYESGKIHHGFNEHRILTPRTDNKTNTLTTVGKDNLICEPICVNSQSGRADGLSKQPSCSDRIYSVDGKSTSLTSGWNQNIAEPFNNFVKNKYDKFAKDKGYIPEMFNPYNQTEIKDKAPTLSAQCGGTTSSSSVLIFDELDKSDISISYFRNFGSKGKILSEQEEKSPTLVAAGGCGGGNVPAIAKSIGLNKLKELNKGQSNRIYRVRGKSVCLNANSGGLGGKTGLYQINLPDGDYIIRKLTPIECERLQTLCDNYTKLGFDGTKEVKISNSARYKALGNGWTVDVIAHILKFLKGD